MDCDSQVGDALSAQADADTKAVPTTANDNTLAKRLRRRRERKTE
jgi:hypothetical protein